MATEGGVMKQLLISIAAAASLASTAMAADVPVKAVPAPAELPPTWSGVYVGAHGGWGRADFDQTIVPNSVVAPIQDLGGINADGWLAGGHLGLLRQWGVFVIGGEISVSSSNIKGSNACTVSGTASTCEARMDWLVLALARAGITPRDNWLIYATGGVGIAGFTADYTNNVSAPEGNRRGTTTATAGALGAGVEYAFGNGIVFGVEYLHLFFNQTRTVFVDDVFDSLNSRLSDVDLVRGRLSVRWGGPAGLVAPAAAPMPVKARPAVLAGPSPIWSGVYVGAHGGWGRADFDQTIVPNSAVAPIQDLGGINADGWLAGGHLGLLRQWGMFVIGGEISVSSSNIKGSNACTVSGAASTCEARMDWLVLALARAGITPRDNWLIYATGGVGIAGFTADYTNAGAPEGNRRGTTTATAGALGAGVEYAFGNGIVFGVEYLHLFFNQTRTVFVDDVFNSLNSRLSDVDLVRGRLSVRWGGGEGTAVAAAPPAQPWTWTGVYAGAHGGWGRADVQQTLVLDSVAVAPQDLGGINADGWLAGGHLGLLRQWGMFVIGGEISVSLSNINGSNACAPEAVASTCKTRMDWLVLALARAGFTPRDNWLIYATGGWAIAGFTGEWLNTNAPEGFARGTTTTHGGALGGGVEYAFGSGIVFGVEYLHLFFNQTRTVFVDDVAESLNAKVKGMDLVRGRLSIRWGGGA